MGKLKRVTKMLLMVGLGLLSPSLLEDRAGHLSAQSDSVKITITNIGNAINTPYDEFAPVISADGLMMVFSSNRSITESDIEKNKQGMENIYVSYYNDMTWKWTEAKMLGKTINKPNKNNSAIALANDGQRMLIYIDNQNGNIYESDLEGEEWSEPHKLPEPVNSDKYESSAAISPDGRTIYFVSNRKGGQGGLDIWLCNKDHNGNWGKAENLGTDINTSENEECVFIHPDGKTLYFSSKGHTTIGGYDIFKSVLKNPSPKEIVSDSLLQLEKVPPSFVGINSGRMRQKGQGGRWTTPVNLGAPINTPNDDLFFVLTADGKTGYYTSSSPGTGGVDKKDIYEITFKYFKKKKSEARLTLFKGVLIDSETKKPISADIEISDNDKNKIIANVKSNSATGKYLISLPAGKNYGITVKREGYLFYSENLNISDSAAFSKIVKNIPLQKISIGNKVTLKNVFYDS